MKKMNFLLVAACLFIGFVMLSLMKQGVSLKERKMIKWSEVESPQKAGVAVARHIYPMLNEQKEFFIQGQGDFAQGFKDSFVKATESDQVKAQIHTDMIPRGYRGMILSIDALKEKPAESSCTSGNKMDCLKIKSFNKFAKKQRDPNLLWIQMWRVSKDQIQLFYR